LKKRKDQRKGTIQGKMDREPEKPLEGCVQEKINEGEKGREREGKGKSDKSTCRGTNEEKKKKKNNTAVAWGRY